MKDSIIRRLVIICCLMCIFPLVMATFLGQVQFVWFVFFLLTLPTLFLTVLITLFIKKRLISPLSMLVEQANTISTGDLSQPIVYEKEDEIGHFIASFDRMRINLYEQQQQQRQFEIERKNFIDGISHDLKTPIASISAYIEALQDKMAATPEEEKHYFEIVENKLSALTELSNQLSLSYTTPDSLHLTLQEVSCYEWTVDLFKSIRSECLIRGIAFELRNRLDVNDPAAMCIDAYQLERAVQNMLSNAYRHTRELLAVSAEINEHRFVLCIENDGVRLDPGKTEVIFERFYTEENLEAQGHLGLGLHITRTIIKSMQGTITADVNAGLIRFEMSLPLQI